MAFLKPALALPLSCCVSICMWVDISEAHAAWSDYSDIIICTNFSNFIIALKSINSIALEHCNGITCTQHHCDTFCTGTMVIFPFCYRCPSHFDTDKWTNDAIVYPMQYIVNENARASERNFATYIYLLTFWIAWLTRAR